MYIYIYKYYIYIYVYILFIYIYIYDTYDTNIISATINNHEFVVSYQEFGNILRLSIGLSSQPSDLRISPGMVE